MGFTEVPRLTHLQENFLLKYQRIARMDESDCRYPSNSRISARGKIFLSVIGREGGMVVSDVRDDAVLVWLQIDEHSVW